MNNTNKLICITYSSYNVLILSELSSIVQRLIYSTIVMINLDRFTKTFTIFISLPFRVIFRKQCDPRFLR